MAKYTKRADGRYVTTIQNGYDPDTGKPALKYIYSRTVAGLEKQKAEFIMQKEKGLFVDDKNISVSDWAWNWLKLCKSGKGHNTYKMYENVIRNHIEPTLGMLKLKNLKSHHIQALVNQRRVDGYTRIIEQILLTLNSLLKAAVKAEYIYKNVAEDVECLQCLLLKRFRLLIEIKEL